MSDTGIAQQEPGTSPGKLLATFLRLRNVSPTAAARELRVSHTAVFSWITEEAGKTPSHPLRAAIEKWTSGFVPAAAWETAEEREIVERVQPFGSAPTEQLAA